MEISIDEPYNPGSSFISKIKIASRLRLLAIEMNSVAIMMLQAADRENFGKHAKELSGAADMVQEWSQEIGGIKK